MSRIAAKFEELSFKKEGALVTFLVAGDPTPHLTLKMAEILEDSGVDMIELGLPFSDPVADGSTIQASAARALQSGMNTDIYFALMKK
ncbi:MAG: tryptophan synthase subunit alpha, partial [Candidatus Hadarchaeum sp.]